MASSSSLDRWRWIRTPGGAIGAALLLIVVLTAVVAPAVVGGHANHIDVSVAGQGPSSHHLLGTDALGRDIMLRVLVASRLSIELALLATALGLVLGVALGTAPTLLGRTVGRLVDTVIGVTIAFPGLLLVLFLAVVFGVTTAGAVLALSLAGVPYTARLVRNLIRSVESLEYVAAARICGAGRVRILVRHILPNVAEPLIVSTTIGAGGTILSFAGLSFLGIGVQPPSYDWGQLLNNGLSSLYANPAAALGPAVVVVIAGLAFNLLGEAAAQQVAGQDGGGAPATQPLVNETIEHGDAEASGAGPARDEVLCVEGLQVSYRRRRRAVNAVRGVSFGIGEGETVGVVGESGSGKSTVALAVAQLVEFPGSIGARQLDFNGQDLRSLSRDARRRLLGTELAVVFQDPMSSFNPVRRLGTQLTDGARYHQNLNRKKAISRVVERLTSVGIPAAETRVHDYPHQFSGGMRQRAMIAMGLMGTPRLVIADEPTTALDVTTESRVLALFDKICREQNAALLLISHDITVVRRACARVLIMYAGRIVEDLPSAQLWTAACHPYTRALLAAIPDIETDRRMPLTVIPGRAPDSGETIEGCAFAPRCPAADDRCRIQDPSLSVVDGPHRVACWNPQSPETDDQRPRMTEGARNG